MYVYVLVIERNWFVRQCIMYIYVLVIERLVC